MQELRDDVVRRLVRDEQVEPRAGQPERLDLLDGLVDPVQPVEVRQVHDVDAGGGEAGEQGVVVGRLAREPRPALQDEREAVVAGGDELALQVVEAAVGQSGALGRGQVGACG